jgi:Rrf2 family cysteine metabolism transcriptional repressor
MRLSSKGEYATRAILELSRRYRSNETVSVDIIAKAQSIPPRFLEQILLSLRRAGFVRSRRGPKGGYILAKPPAQISIAAVTRAIDGPLAPVACVSQLEHEDCELSDTCELKELWQEVRDMISDMLEEVSFQDILDKSWKIGEGIRSNPE